MRKSVNNIRDCLDASAVSAGISNQYRLHVMSTKLLLLGDEAIARGALDAGISGVYAYPGTPSTEITEYIQNSVEASAGKIHCKWASNEKTAMEAALGMSYVGKRSLVCMKHVGMNVAADAFVNSAMSGVNGGLVVVAADDPSMHSSQNEQDSRFYGKFAMVPVLEPSTQQELYDMTRYAFDLSEKFSIPVLLRIVTRIAHSRAVVETVERRAENDIHYPEDPGRWVLMPSVARRRNDALIKMQADFAAESESSGNNILTSGVDRRFGVIACGVAYNYLMEHIVELPKCPVLKVSQYPLPKKLISDLASQCDALVVLEDGQPFVEEQLRGVFDGGIKIIGRLSGEIPRTGELDPDNILPALGLSSAAERQPSEYVVPRPPALCVGCGHRDLYTALNEVLSEYENAKVFSDIGCYTLGFLSPFHAIHSVIDMGASVTMAKGASDAGQYPSVAVIGDSTFTHSGMTGLLDAVNCNADITVIISDNLTTGMTGGQDSAGTGRYEQICAGIGVAPEHIRVVVPLPKNMEEMKMIIREEIDYHGVSVIIPRRECIQTARRKAASKR